MRFRQLTTRLTTLIAGVAAFACESCAADDPPAPEAGRPLPIFVAGPPPPRHSIMVLAGRLATTDIWSTAIFNLNNPNPHPHYDNYFVGAAYGRELWYPGLGFVIGGEFGIGDRFGKFKSCCDPPVKTSETTHSVEFWGGASFGHAGLEIGGLRFKPTIVVGVSAITNPIGGELAQQSQRGNKNAHVLFYLGPELTLVFASNPNLEFVARLQHRSGLYGTIGGMKEGYNANLFGTRFRF
jgi:hypothetical protein